MKLKEVEDGVLGFSTEKRLVNETGGTTEETIGMEEEETKEEEEWREATSD